MAEHKILELPGFTTQKGITFDAKLAYATYGELTPARDNVVVIPTFYGGRHPDTEYFMAPGRVLDTQKYFVVIPNMFGNGLSSSPSNTDGSVGRGAFPLMTLFDNVTAQHHLLTEHLGIDRIKLVVGFSMGAQQTFQWGALFPEMVSAIAPICGSGRTSPHNHLMVDGPKAALLMDAAFKDGWYEEPPMQGLLAFGRVYAGWLWSQTFFRERLYENLGLQSVEDVVRFTQNYFLQNDANDLLAMANTWQHGDISDNPKFLGDFDAALASITCRAIVMPATTDLYFRVPDNEYEVSRMPNAELRPIKSDYGHAAGFGAAAADNDFIDAALSELLN
ncbi:MAG: alpha/beta fold hydrolase [Gammaproteobacteria bacterium]